MILPGNVSPVDQYGWSAVITYDEDNYVSDEGAEPPHYDRTNQT